MRLRLFYFCNQHTFKPITYFLRHTYIVLKLDKRILLKPIIYYIGKKWLLTLISNVISWNTISWYCCSIILNKNVIQFYITVLYIHLLNCTWQMSTNLNLNPLIYIKKKPLSTVIQSYIVKLLYKLDTCTDIFKYISIY